MNYGISASLDSWQMQCTFLLKSFSHSVWLFRIISNLIMRSLTGRSHQVNRLIIPTFILLSSFGLNIIEIFSVKLIYIFLLISLSRSPLPNQLNYHSIMCRSIAKSGRIIVYGKNCQVWDFRSGVWDQWARITLTWIQSSLFFFTPCHFGFLFFSTQAVVVVLSVIVQFELASF